MSDLVRGARPVAEAIAARLDRLGASLTPEQFARMQTVCADKEDYRPMWQRSETTHARKEREKARRRRHDGVR